jgi:hypothetical protein
MFFVVLVVTTRCKRAAYEAFGASVFVDGEAVAATALFARQMCVYETHSSGITFSHH